MSALATPSSTPFSLSSPSSTYTPIRELGRGTYGIVTLCTSSTSTTPVAIKRMATIVTSFPTPAAKANALKKAKYIGVSISALREVKILREFSQKRSSTGHPGSNFILPLLDCFTPPNTSDICAVYEFCPTDLLKVLSNTNTAPVTESAVKSFMHSLCQGVSFVHSQNVLHRDLKPDNLLFTSDNVMRIGDFGLARTKSAPQKPMSIEAITLWYKPPEMLLGEPFYSTAVDMWSVGCIFFEMLARRPFLPGGPGDNDQLSKIFQQFGPPSSENWPTFDLLPNVVRGIKWTAGAPPVPLSSTLPNATEAACDLLSKIMQLDPSKRLTADLVLQHRYFTESPAMCKDKDLPIPK